MTFWIDTLRGSFALIDAEIGPITPSERSTMPDDDKPWTTQTAQQMRDYAAAAGIDLSHLPAKAPKREIHAAINSALARQAVSAAREVGAVPDGMDLAVDHAPGLVWVEDPNTGDGDFIEADSDGTQAAAMTNGEKAAAYDRIMREQRDEMTDRERELAEDAVRRWHSPDEGDVDVLDAARERTGSLLPTKAQWTQIEVMGESLSHARLVKAKQLNTAADVKLILLAARDLGIPPTMAVQQIHVIDGKPSLSAQLMVALVRNAGYSIIPTVMTAERAVAKGTRLDEVVEFEFTWEEAVLAGLTGKDNYKHYPKAMLWSRAVSGLCRVLFPDVLAGLTYTPEELGSDDWSDDAPIRVESSATTEPGVDADGVVDDPLLDDLERAGITAAIMQRDEPTRDALRAEWARLQEARQLRGLLKLRQSDRVVLAGLLSMFPPCDADSAAAESDPAPEPGPVEEVVTSPLLNAPADDGPEDAMILCPNCGTDVTVENAECQEHPF